MYNTPVYLYSITFPLIIRDSCQIKYRNVSLIRLMYNMQSSSLKAGVASSYQPHVFL